MDFYWRKNGLWFSIIIACIFTIGKYPANSLILAESVSNLCILYRFSFFPQSDESYYGFLSLRLHYPHFMEASRIRDHKRVPPSMYGQNFGKQIRYRISTQLNKKTGIWSPWESWLLQISFPKKSPQSHREYGDSSEKNRDTEHEM